MLDMITNMMRKNRQLGRKTKGLVCKVRLYLWIKVGNVLLGISMQILEFHNTNGRRKYLLPWE